MAKNSKKKALTKEEKRQRQVKSLFKRKIRSVFAGAGFTYFPTNGHEMVIGLRTVEIDSLFIFENVWLICEDTIKTTGIREHIRTKNEAFGEIKSNLVDFVDKLEAVFPEKKELLRRYEISRLQIFGLYIPREELDLSNSDMQLFSNIRFMQPKTLNYLQWIVQCVKFSARNEIFRFLELSNQQIGMVSSSSSSAEITAPIIYPKEFTGFKNQVRIVSFMMSAEDLLDTCYVLRKDNWEESIWLYQRLIDKNKIKSIRSFLESKGEAFLNNIIVALPDNVSFSDNTGRHHGVEEMNALDNSCKLVLPKKMNSICVIDGQHRIFSHYESGANSKQEQTISKLRKQLHLLVTGLVFSPDISSEERARIQSEIFLDINSTVKTVPPSVLMHIKRISNPIADESIAQFVIEKLNKDGIFKKQFQVSSLDNARIKTASIVRFALRYLVTVKPAEGKNSLINFWTGNKKALLDGKSEAVESYVKFCTDTLRNYFGAICKNMKTEWADENSKLLSVISLNGFIIAFTRQLNINGVQDFEFYDELFSKWKFDFSKEGFPYTSSQYRKFSSDILESVFGLTASVVETL